MRKMDQKHKELLLYLVFGVLTTLVNFVAFAGFDKLLGQQAYLVSNAIAWIIAVIFAYITNKLFVFEAKRFSPKVLAVEFGEFLLARVFSFVVEEAGMWLFVEALGFRSMGWKILGIFLSGQMMAKVVLAVIVVIMNYFFSKFFIFKKEK